jgi:hypothetical protein
MVRTVHLYMCTVIWPTSWTHTHNLQRIQITAHVMLRLLYALFCTNSCCTAYYKQSLETKATDHCKYIPRIPPLVLMQFSPHFPSVSCFIFLEESISVYFLLAYMNKVAIHQHNILYCSFVNKGINNLKSITPEAGVLKKLSLAGLAKISRLR